ncbi:KRAB-A domain-containing protein 2-like [Diabrotica undecimpunctata]|uniref:KRAB-A domain-containing protein 2-like n=1 Tax=Diabrotica undecimpunctata TaxID=50387 RepID=UPI003B6355CA
MDLSRGALDCIFEALYRAPGDNRRCIGPCLFPRGDINIGHKRKKGAPYILQGDNGLEFANSVIVELTTMWLGLKRANQDVRDMLIIWVNDNNNTKWSERLRFIQSEKNRSFHRGIGSSPYFAMFGSRQTNSLEHVRLPKDVLDKLQNEEDLEKLINSMEKKATV